MIKIYFTPSSYDPDYKKKNQTDCIKKACKNDKNETIKRIIFVS